MPPGSVSGYSVRPRSGPPGLTGCAESVSLRTGSRASDEGGVKRIWLHFLYLLYCVEAGIFLILVPWSLLWTHSYFSQIPGLGNLLLSGYVKGAVTAFGLLHLLVASRDFLAFCRAVKEV